MHISRLLLNLSSAYVKIMADLEEMTAGIQLGAQKINKLSYVNITILLAANK